MRGGSGTGVEPSFSALRVAFTGESDISSAFPESRVSRATAGVSFRPFRYVERKTFRPKESIASPVIGTAERVTVSTLRRMRT
jgi:hypothetical protein